ncbi:MAG: transcription termination/antitermination factor NusG [Clostridia bacterium]|nr:transcription termination/antitermination factor NusG [Clostridia bacterium]MBQ6570136.1 transcription termination/antitermination factor NusG [Clostridia bacterium]
MEEAAKWYVAHTYSGYENKVATTLQTLVENRGCQDLIQEILVPTETVTEITETGKQKEVERKTFPGYVFIKMVMTDETWYIVRNIRGCTGFVGPESKPVPLSAEEVERMGVDKRSVEVDYAVGDSVKIIDKRLEGIVGTVEEIDLEKAKVYVSIFMLGSKTTVELDLDQVLMVN